MSYFTNLNLILYMFFIIFGVFALIIFNSETQIENYNHFDSFFCSGWAGECLKFR